MMPLTEDPPIQTWRYVFIALVASVFMAVSVLGWSTIRGRSAPSPYSDIAAEVEQGCQMRPGELDPRPWGQITVGDIDTYRFRTSSSKGWAFGFWEKVSEGPGTPLVHYRCGVDDPAATAPAR